MFSPVGNRPPSVYWRRRIMVIGSVVLLLVLLVLTVRAVTGNDATPVADGSSSTPRPTPSSVSPTSSPGVTSTSNRPGSSSASSSRSSAAGSSTAAPARCLAKDLAVQAVAGQSSYTVGAQPMVELQVTNGGAKPCVQDLADRQVVLMIYNGESRVWGSHDCEIQPGADDRTLLVGTAVRVSITWSGRTSQPGCTGTRQRVGAGTYTLYAELSGNRGRATQFTIN